MLVDYLCKQVTSTLSYCPELGDAVAHHWRKNDYYGLGPWMVGYEPPMGGTNYR